MTMTLATIVVYVAAVAYALVVLLLARCLITRRCVGMDEHAMIPGDERLIKVKDDDAG